MKNLLIYTYFTLLMLAGSAAFAQSSSSKLRDVDDTKIQKLTADLQSKLPDLKNNKVKWLSTDYGYKALYSMGYEDHMSLYDNQGNYRETLKKMVWDKNVAPILKMEFESSEYGLFKVVTFWENISQDTDDYYFELLNVEEEPRNIWADSNGKFSLAPLFMK